MGSDWLMSMPWYGLLALGVVALIVFVGAMDVINFMDGINGITAAYAMAVLVPLWLVNRRLGFVDASFLGIAIIGIAFIMLFALGLLMARTGDVTWMVFLLVYGVDGCCTIVHRMMLRENLGQAQAVEYSVWPGLVHGEGGGVLG